MQDEDFDIVDVNKIVGVFFNVVWMGVVFGCVIILNYLKVYLVVVG